MEDRTALKEKRNNYLWLIWAILTVGISLSLEFVFNLKMAKPLEATFMWAFGLQFVFLICRGLTYFLNQFLLLLFRRKIKINRLKGRVTPIYKIYHEDGYKYFTVTKYSAKYTDLDLEWSIPFSVLFEEQEYVKEGVHYFDYDLDGVTNISLLWEEQDAKEKLEYTKKISAKELKQQKIDNLNNVFNENYK